jgi:hypothetical protein
MGIRKSKHSRPDASDQALAESIRLGRSKRRSQNAQAHRLQGRIELGGVNTVPVVDKEPAWSLSRDDLPELLQRPVRGGMSGGVEVNDPARAHFHDHEDVQHAEAGRHGGEEVASENGLGMIADKGHPTLRRGPARWSWLGGHVTPDRSRGYANPQFQQQFSGDTLLTPSQVGLGHFGNQSLEIGRHRRSTPGRRFPSPEQAKPLPMPSDESIGLDDGQRLSPGEPSGKQDESQFRGSLRPARLNLVVQIQSQLLPKEEVSAAKALRGCRLSRTNLKASSKRSRADTATSDREFNFGINLRFAHPPTPVTI